MIFAQHRFIAENRCVAVVALLFSRRPCQVLGKVRPNLRSGYERLPYSVKLMARRVTDFQVRFWSCRGHNVRGINQNVRAAISTDEANRPWLVRCFVNLSLYVATIQNPIVCAVESSHVNSVTSGTSMFEENGLLRVRSHARKSSATPERSAALGGTKRGSHDGNPR